MLKCDIFTLDHSYTIKNNNNEQVVRLKMMHANFLVLWKQLMIEKKIFQNNNPLKYKRVINLLIKIKRILQAVTPEADKLIHPSTQQNHFLTWLSAVTCSPTTPAQILNMTFPKKKKISQTTLLKIWEVKQHPGIRSRCLSLTAILWHFGIYSICLHAES